jgi:hypothetical protein
MQEFTLLVFVLKYLKHVYWLLFELEAESKNVTNTINNSARDSSVKIHTIIYRREALHFN